jgi:hypothetical protein
MENFSRKIWHLLRRREGMPAVQADTKERIAEKQRPRRAAAPDGGVFF